MLKTASIAIHIEHAIVREWYIINSGCSKFGTIPYLALSPWLQTLESFEHLQAEEDDTESHQYMPTSILEYLFHWHYFVASNFLHLVWIDETSWRGRRKYARFRWEWASCSCMPGLQFRKDGILRLLWLGLKPGAKTFGSRNVGQ